MSPRDDVVLSFSSLTEGQQSSGNLCPKCNGGRSKETTLSVGRSGGSLWWRCHRASCGWVGKDSNASTSLPGETHSTKKSRSVSLDRQRLPSPLKHELMEKYSLDEETLGRAGWSYTPDYLVRFPEGGSKSYGPRVIFPLYGPAGQVRGEQFRSYSGHNKKAMIDGLTDQQMTSWYRWRRYGRVLTIVEDIPSAVRIAQAGVDSLALCGTILNFDRVKEIREQEYLSIHLALDNDAFNQAVRYASSFGKYLPNMRVKYLDMDFKDMPQEMFSLNIQELT